MGSKSNMYKTIVATSDEKNYTAKFTETAPADDWIQSGFSDASWDTGIAPFGDNESISKTKWTSENLWVRRTFKINTKNPDKLFLKLQHDDNVEVYINGHEVYKTKGWTGKFIYIPLNDAASYLKQGNNTLAIHVANTAGGAWLDAGIVQEPEDVLDKGIGTATQNNVNVNATQTSYAFSNGGVDLNLTFTSPLLLNDLEMVSRPISYVTYNVKSNDGKSHAVQVYFGASTNIAVNVATQDVTVKKYAYGGLSILKAGTTAQPILQKKGDDLRIDWGYMHVAVPAAYKASQYITTADNAIASFQKNSLISTATAGKNLMLNTVLNFGNVNSIAKEQTIMVGYDDVYAIQYFNQNLKAWWKNNPSQTIEK
jgi:hypothetical protein